MFPSLRRYSGRMLKFLKRFTQPTFYQKQEPPQPNLLTETAVAAAVTLAVSGPDSSHISQAMMVAKPVVVDAFAKAGAQSGSKSAN